MCAAVTRLFGCCVTSRPPAAARQTCTCSHDDDDTWKPPSLAADTKRQVDCVAGRSSSQSTTCCHCPAGCALDVDPSTPAPVCCCERCDGGWFPPEVSLRMRKCLLEHVTSGVRRNAWTGDVVYLDEKERAEMSLMSSDLKDVDLLVGHYGRVSAADDEMLPPRPSLRLWSPRSELVTSFRCPNRSIGHLYEAVLRHQRTCTCSLPDDLTSLPDDDQTSPSTKSTTLCCCCPSRAKRKKFSSWTRKKKS